MTIYVLMTTFFLIITITRDNGDIYIYIQKSYTNNGMYCLISWNWCKHRHSLLCGLSYYYIYFLFFFENNSFPTFMISITGWLGNLNLKVFFFSPRDLLEYKKYRRIFEGLFGRKIQRNISKSRLKYWENRYTRITFKQTCQHCARMWNCTFYNEFYFRHNTQLIP